MSKSFEEYLTEQLTTPVPEWYSADGSSNRAVVVRMHDKGYTAALKWEGSELTRDVKYFITEEFKGVHTPVIWFVHFTILPVLVPVSLFVRTSSRYREAIAEYRKDYERKCRTVARNE